MRKIILTLVPAFGLLLPLMAQAQDAIYLSNLGESSTGSAAVASDTWLAQPFITGTNSRGYTLDSIQLLMDAASGNPSDFAVSLYKYPRLPTVFLGSLIGSINPSTDGLFTYAASNLVLSPATGYCIVLTAATPIANGYYNWSIANDTGYSSSDGWGFVGGYLSSTSGSSWNYIGSDPVQFAVYATPIPEPAMYALAGLGLAALSFRRRKP